MKTQHTPGPWTIVRVQNHPDNDGEQVAFIQTKKICLDLTAVENDKMTREEFKAYAHLIAAAPELLEALNDIVKLYEKNYRYPEKFPQYKIAKKTITKYKEAHP